MTSPDPSDLSVPACTAFAGWQIIASGALAEVALKTREMMEEGIRDPVLVFDDDTSQLIEVDFRGSREEVLARLAPVVDVPPRRGPGRPKLGVVPREVTLLPRHWEWLTEQPGGASVVLRRLVDAARRASEPKDRVRRAQEAVHRFMHAMTGDLPGFEEASRAFYAGRREAFRQQISSWPEGVRAHLEKLAARAFSAVEAAADDPG